MSANIRNTIASWFKVVSTVAILSCTAASCGPGRVVGIGPQCAFSDPEFTTSLGICNLAAEYYLAKQEWPLSKEQLEEQNQRVLAQAGELPPEQAKEWSEFLGRFTLLDMKRQGENLVLHYRFRIDTKTIDQTVTLRPKPTADEILEAATAE